MEKFVRKLAKSYQYQFLYRRAKEMSNINLFYNNIDFSRLQLLFLKWLQIYNVLYDDLQMKKSYISQEVIDDEMRTEAYLLYKSQEEEKPKSSKQQKRQRDTSGNLPSVIFKEKH